MDYSEYNHFFGNLYFTR